jgi:phospholipid/cholesterol/gamma-HCH transport system substrate-binding protein
MIFGKSRLELKVGIFVFIGLTILATFILLIGHFKTLAISHRVDFLFNFVNGVKVGAPIRFAGVDIGEVKALKVAFVPDEGKNKIRVIGWLRKDVKIPSDSTVWVNTLGLLGEKYIEIMPGNNYKDLVAVNQVIVGNDPIPMHELTLLVKGIADNLDEIILKVKNKEGTVGRLISDDSLYKELEASIVSIRGELEGLLSDIRQHPWKLFFKTKEKPQKTTK